MLITKKGKNVIVPVDQCSVVTVCFIAKDAKEERSWNEDGNTREYDWSIHWSMASIKMFKVNVIITVNFKLLYYLLH